MTNDEHALMMGVIDTSVTFFSCPWSATFLPSSMRRLGTEIHVISKHNLQIDYKLSRPKCHWLYLVAALSGFFLRQVSMNRNKEYYLSLMKLHSYCQYLCLTEMQLLPSASPYSVSGPSYPNTEWSKNPFRSHFHPLYLI